MFRVLTQETAEKELLGQECQTARGSFMASANQMQTMIELVRSITYEYFQSDLPVLAQKVMELFTGALNMHCSLSLFREVMAQLKKQSELLTFYKGYLITMNRQLSCLELYDANELPELDAGEGNLAFEEAVSQKSRVSENTAIQPQEEGKIDMEVKQEGEKTMESEIMETQSSSFIQLYESSISKFEQFLKRESFSAVSPSTVEKNQATAKKLNDSSFELKDFQKKGKSLMDCSFETLMRDEIKEDLKREAVVTPDESKLSYMKELRYNKQIKDTLMNSKLKMRKKR